MHPGLGKYVSFFEPVSKTNGATASGYIDTLGYDYASIGVVLSGSDNATNNPSVLLLAEGDTTSAFTNISGAVGDTDFTISTALITAGAGSDVFQFNVDLRGRKRYIKVAVSPITTQICAAAAYLQRGEIAPLSAADAGVLNLVNL